MRLQFQPMPLLRKRVPFDDSNFIFEVKWDGFRTVAVIERGRTELVSRNGHRFAAFADLERLISNGLPDTRAVIDGEICSLDTYGRPHFRNLLFHRGNYPCLLAFDLLMLNGKDCRRESLLDRKQELRRLLTGVSANSRLRYADHIETVGTSLFDRVCALDLEGIVAKQKFSPYTADRDSSTWFKIRNPQYSQMVGRAELFERERHDEPVPGWHRCTLACISTEAA
jgi:bifunctional non-homologous end joining protein LigD